jgi:elongation factor 1 alpha-like protein
VSQLAVVVNKLDNCKWAKERYDEIVFKLGPFLKQAGFKEADVTFVPCSGLSGQNLAKRSTESLLTSWYSGPCLVDVIDNFKPPERLIAKPLRFSVGDIFKGQTAGISVAGVVESGSVVNGQKLIIMPAGESCQVKLISVDETGSNQAFAGDHVILVVVNCDIQHLTVGSLLCDPSCPTKVTSRFEARIVVFHNCEIPITKGLPVVIHYNSASEQATIKRLLSQLNKSTGEVIKRRPRCLTRNTSGLVEIEVNRPICVELYKEYKGLGRFMVRVGGNTVAAGLVNAIL